MSNKYVLMITALIIFIVILSEIHSNKTKQQLQNDLQKAEERLENSKKSNMEINWVIVGWLIDMILNGFVWLVIAAISLSLIDVTDKWTRKALKWMDKADTLIRKFTDDAFEWIQKKNLNIIASIVLLIIFGVLAQFGIIPKLIT